MSAAAETNDFAWWQAALAGNSQPIHENEPQAGYFKTRRGKDQPWLPVCIYRDAGKLVAFVGDSPADPAVIWTYVANRPISYELYTAVADRGEPWPEDITAEIEKARPAEAAIGHNSGRPEDEIRDEIETLDRAFTAWLAEIGGTITTEEQDAKAETFRTRFAEIEKRAKAAQKVEKEPFLEGGRKVDAKWKPLDAAADAGKRRVGGVVTPYRVDRDRKRQEAERKAREEAERARQEAARKAAEAEAAGAPPPPPSPPELTRRAAAPTGLRTYRVCVITDLPAAVGAILALPTPPAEFTDVVKTIARRLIEAGVAVPGAEIREEKRA